MFISKPKRTGIVVNKNNSPVNIRFVAKTSDIRNFSENIRSDVKTSEVATLMTTVTTSPVVLHWLCDSPWTGCAWKTTPYIHVARTSINRVIVACELYCCLLPQCETLRICRSGFPIATPPPEMSGLPYFALQVESWFLKTQSKSNYSPKFFQM